MTANRAKTFLASATLALTLATGLGGCAPRVVTPVVPVAPVAPVAPAYPVTNEEAFVNEAVYQGDFSAMTDQEVLALGYQACTDLDYQPENAPTIYYDYFLMLSVQYLCPEHESTLYSLGLTN